MTELAISKEKRGLECLWELFFTRAIGRSHLAVLATLLRESL